MVLVSWCASRVGGCVVAGMMPAPATDAKGRFVAGNCGNGGRPKGSRNALSERFVGDLYADWSKHGTEVLRIVRAIDPVAYAKIVALMSAKGDDGARPEGITVVNVITGVRG
jgi:hypothetical protein